MSRFLIAEIKMSSNNVAELIFFIVLCKMCILEGLSLAHPFGHFEIPSNVNE